MKKSTYIYGIIIAIFFLVSCENKREYHNEWVQRNNYLYYYDDNGQIKKDGTFYIDNNWYYFDENGKMRTGWYRLNDKNVQVYLGNDGILRKGWQKIGDNWYYFTETLGFMVTGWNKVDNEWYYFDKNNGDLQISRWIDSSYYVDSDGKMLRNTKREISGEQYAFNSDGIGMKIPDYQLLVECPATLWANDCMIRINNLRFDLSDLHSGLNMIKYDCDFTVLNMYYGNTNEAWIYYKLFDPDGYLLKESFIVLASNLNKSSNKNIKVKGTELFSFSEGKGSYKLVIYSYK